MQMNAKTEVVEKTKVDASENGRRLAAGLEDMVPAVVALVLIAIIGVVGALILVNFQTNPSVATSNAALNATNFGLSGINTLLSFLPLIALVIVAAILIGIVLVAFALGGRGGGERF